MKIPYRGSAIKILETPEEGPDLRECNDLQLRPGHIIQTEGNKTVQIEDQLPKEQLLQEEDENRQQTQNQATTSSPPFPERLVIPRPIQQPNFDILGELQNLYIKIPFLQAIQDIPIYAKTIKELCIKRPRRNVIDNPRVQVVGTLSHLLSGKETPIKYEDPGGPPLILGRPWLATDDAYIGYQQGNMIITKGADINNLVLYPPTQPSITIVKTNRHPVSYLTDNIRSPLTIQEVLEFKNQTKDDAINNFISQTELTSRTQFHMIKAAFDNEVEEEPLKDAHDHTIPVTSVAHSKIVEIEPGKTLNINAKLTPEQETKLIHILTKYKNAFAWDYLDMKGIDPQLCTHHIYIENDAKPVRQPQRRLNPHLKEVVKAELQKLLYVNFIYPIFDSKWVFPLVVVPKKNGKWRICVDYRELNKATQKDHFPLPFIDHVLDTLAGKKFFSFLDGFSGYNQIQIAPEDQDKTTFTCPWGTFAYQVLPFSLCNAPATFQRAILSIFADLINEGLEVYMDDFTPYREEFDPALETLEKVLQRCIATRLCLSHEKCYMMMIEGLILGHYISAADIQVDPAKIQILLLIPTPTTQTEDL
eukprot:PITA_12276